MRRFVAALVTLFCVSALRAADLDIVKPRYWQMLPGVSAVWVDRAGNPWFQTPTGDVAASYPAGTKTVPLGQTMLLGDKAGRIWVTDRTKDGAARYFDGRQWNETNVKARSAFEDSAGRVFLADPTHVHVFADYKWRPQEIFATPSRVEGRFVEDSKGRTWFWAPRIDKIRRGTKGAWAFEKDNWTRHHEEAGFPADDIVALVPLADDRLLVVGDKPAPAKNYAAWSPSRRLDEKERDPFAAFGPKRVYFVGTDPAGQHLFALDGVKPEPGEAWSRVRYATLSPAGEAKLLPRDRESLAQRLHATAYDSRPRVLTRLDQEPPPVPAGPDDAIAQDGAGRIYVHMPGGIGVVWPKYEQPGDVLRLTRSARLIDRMIQDETGVIWGVPQEPGGPSCLLRWDGRAWADTPAKLTPHPAWMKRSAPPWAGWPTGPFVNIGRGGTVLVVVTRDIHQDGAKSPDGTKTRWLEGWLFRDGQWTGPTEIEQLLKQHRATLAKAFTDGPRRADYLALQGEGQKLWAVFDNKVWLFDGDKVAAWRLPADEPHVRRFDFLRTAALYRLPDGGILCVSPLPGNFGTFALGAKDGKITAVQFPAPPWPDYLDHYDPPALRMTADKTFWLWLASRGGRPDSVFVYRNEKWAERKDLGRPLFERDGELWCLPGPGPGTPGQKFAVVKDDQTEVVSLPPEYGHGYRPADSLTAAGYWLLTLDAKSRKITGAVILNQYVTGGPAFRDGHGHVLLPGGWFGKDKN
ncbi:MAG: hypothetical protein ACJ8F7_10445 [Gemmataceae bacterium]